MTGGLGVAMRALPLYGPRPTEAANSNKAEIRGGWPAGRAAGRGSGSQLSSAQARPDVLHVTRHARCFGGACTCQRTVACQCEVGALPCWTSGSLAPKSPTESRAASAARVLKLG